jgi:peptidoglycan/xylan/chitin deacetylase (PgdA/CDA1 family)
MALAPPSPAAAARRSCPDGQDDVSRRDDTIVLCYHAVSDDWPHALAVSTAQLRAQLSILVDRGYRGIRFRDVVDRPRGRNVAVTFDDAYRSTVAHAAPVLAELGLPGTVFAPTSYIGIDAPMVWPGIDELAQGPHAAELLPATWDELRSLARAGWEVGSHTVTHPRLPEIDDEQLREELQASRDTIAAEIGEPCVTIAYPYGRFDDRVTRAAAAAGYSLAGVLDRQATRPSPMAWPRVGVYAFDSLNRFKLKIAPSLRGLLGSAAILGVRRARGLLGREHAPAHVS